MTALRVLFVAPYVPSLRRSRSYNLIRELAAAGHRVTLIAAHSADDGGDLAAMRPFCEHARGIPVSRAQALWSCVRHLPRSVPLQAAYGYSPELERAVGRALAAPGPGGERRPYDVLHVEHLRAAMSTLPAGGVPRIYDAVDCMTRLSEQAMRQAATAAHRLTARLESARTRHFETHLTRAFDRVLASSAQEADALAALAARNGAAQPSPPITVLRNGVHLAYFRPTDAPREPATVVFVGRMGYHANLAGATALLRQIMPVVWSRRPEVRLLLVGENPPRSLSALAERAGPRVELTGRVPDIRPYLARATVAVSPLPYAAGIQNKVIEAMAAGVPVVATPVSVAALSATPDVHLLVARTPVEMATRIVDLLADPDSRRRLAAAGRHYVERHHDWSAAAGRLVGIYREEVERWAKRGDGVMG
jgi:glycosyltransferase involved in cell wall biosynthesis